MFLACYTRRQKTREQAALETLLERQLEGEVSQGADNIAALHDLGLEQLFTPGDRVMTAQAANSIKNRFPHYAWENADIAKKPS